MTSKNISFLGLKKALMLGLLFISVPGLAKSKQVSKPAVSATSQIVNLTFLPQSKVYLNGDSSVRKFSASSGGLDLRATAKEKPLAEGTLPWIPVEAEMFLVVKNLKSGNETLDDHMFDNLKADVYPQIQLRLTDFSYSDVMIGNQMTASGTLTVAGVTKPIELMMNLTIEDQNLRITGNKILHMSDFGIVPPTMMMGALKTRDEIEIVFDVFCLINGKKKD